jgi:hypothetical protein
MDSRQEALCKITHALEAIAEALRNMPTGEPAFDADLSTYLAAVTTYVAAVNAYIAAVAAAVPPGVDLSAEDAQVQAAGTALATAQAAIGSATP